MTSVKEVIHPINRLLKMCAKKYLHMLLATIVIGQCKATLFKTNIRDFQSPKDYKIFCSKTCKT